MALAQLVAQQLMLTQLYRFGFINSGDFLNTELDFAYQRSRQLATNLPMGDTRLQGFRITSEELTDSPLAPNLLPILMHARLFGVPLEFVNLLIALFAYSIAYPSVFWRASRVFACAFSLYLVVHCASLIWSYLQWSVLFRVQETNYYSPRPVGIGQHLWALRPDWIALFHPLSLLATFVATVVLMHAAPVALYAYGFSKYVQCQREHHSEAMLTMGGQHGGGEPSPPSSRGYIAANGIFPPSSRENSASSGSTMLKRGAPLSNPAANRRGDDDEWATRCCEGYTSHVGAILLLILIVVVKAPSLYAMMLLYQHEEKPLILTCIIVDIVYLFSWIVLWLFLTLKRDWDFRVWLRVEELVSLQDAHRIPVAGGSGGGRRTPSDLKNALLLMHGKRMYVTDDPLAKSSIWRYATKCSPGPNSNCQQQRSKRCCSQRGCDAHKSSAVCLYPFAAGSPALSSVRKGRVGSSQVDQYVPMAAPPYQRRQQIALDTGSEGQFVVNTFGTLQRGSGAAAANGGDYGGVMMSAASGYHSASGGYPQLYAKAEPSHPPQAAYYSSSTLGRTRVGNSGLPAASSPHMQNRHSQQSQPTAGVYATSTLTGRTGQAHAYTPTAQQYGNLYGSCYTPMTIGENRQYASGMHPRVQGGLMGSSPQPGSRQHLHGPSAMVCSPVMANNYATDVYGNVYSSPYVHSTGSRQQSQGARWHQPPPSQHSDVVSDVASDTTSCPNSTTQQTDKEASRPSANGGRRTTAAAAAAGYATYDGLVVRSGVSGGGGSDTLTRHHPILTATMVRAKELARKEPPIADSNGPIGASVAAIAPTPAPRPLILGSSSIATDQHPPPRGSAAGSTAMTNGEVEESATPPSATYSVKELEEMVNEFATSVV